MTRIQRQLGFKKLSRDNDFSWRWEDRRNVLKQEGQGECLLLQDKPNSVPLLQRVKPKTHNLHSETKCISIACIEWRETAYNAELLTASPPRSDRKEEPLSNKEWPSDHTHMPESLESSPWAIGAGAKMSGFFSIWPWPCSKTKAADAVESK